ncbi:MAG: 3-methyl-2-oxobutanoate hydroxymethyltransferase [Halobacteriovoraceae bacterium]|nr:3-methyl-2-oxobutanoate hydroxymethyltransferase [Halobacteriovoraceae bacterium]MCB9095649.1 3-methyl-2-oxobutanoate hydroxymethyltransferase [Halobacteriovoraceae bacterium]
MKKLTTRDIRKFKGQKKLSVLTCYDFQTAQIINESELDMILVGDSLGNVILGYETTIPVTIDNMILFGQAVRRGAPNKFVIVDMPFGSYSDIDEATHNGIKLFQQTQAEAIKLEGGSSWHAKLIEHLTLNGIPVMGHLGLRPQSVHAMGGYYTHGKDDQSSQLILEEAKRLEEAGCFAIVLECVEKNLAQQISDSLSIPTIGIGSGSMVDGQVLVINDLLHEGVKDPPRFCTPLANLYQTKKKVIEDYINNTKTSS